jgi:hypothetical protein
MHCSKCGSDNREGRKFCANCGAALAITCSKCGVPNQLGEKFCGECGATLSRSAEPAIAQSPPSAPSIRVTHEPTDAQAEDPAHLEGERKTVTALFADLKEAKALLDELSRKRVEHDDN